MVTGLVMGVLIAIDITGFIIPVERGMGGAEITQGIWGGAGINFTAYFGSLARISSCSGTHEKIPSHQFHHIKEHVFQK